MRIPPPFYFLGSMVIGAALGVFLPLPIEVLPEGIADLIGNLLMGVGIVLALLSLRELRKARTSYDINKSASSLVTTGPYAISRNPIYLSWAVVQLGLGLWLRNTWIVILLVPAILLVNVLAIIPEERFLQGVFGQSYQDYRKRVRRWL